MESRRAARLAVPGRYLLILKYTLSYTTVRLVLLLKPFNIPGTRGSHFSDSTVPPRSDATPQPQLYNIFPAASVIVQTHGARVTLYTLSRTLEGKKEQQQQLRLLKNRKTINGLSSRQSTRLLLLSHHRWKQYRAAAAWQKPFQWYIGK